MMIRNAAAQAIEEAVAADPLAKDWMTQKEFASLVCRFIGYAQMWRGIGLKVATFEGKTLISKQKVNRFVESLQQ